MREKKLAKYEYVVFTQKDGKMIKRYYYNVKDANGRLCKKFFYAEKVGPFEKIKLKKQKATKKFEKLPKNKQVCLKMIAATSALLVASSIALGFMLANENSDKKSQDFDRNESGYVQREEMEEKKETELKVPVPKTYEQNGNTFLSLDSALEISHYNYEQLKKELVQYNKTASEKNKYNFNPAMFDSAIFVGVQVKESSLILNDADDKSYKGGFKIGAEALKEANEVSIALTGQPVALTEEELNDPIKSSKACMYCYVKNYEYLYDEINNKNLNVEISDKMVIDEYLFGCGNLFKELNGSGYFQKSYSKTILDYAEILRPFSQTVLKGNASEEELVQQRRTTYNKLYKVPEKYAEKAK